MKVSWKDVGIGRSFGEGCSVCVRGTRSVSSSYWGLEVVLGGTSVSDSTWREV